MNGDALLLFGEPGVGKTVLLDAVADAASAAGTRVLRTGGRRIAQVVRSTASSFSLAAAVPMHPKLKRQESTVVGHRRQQSFQRRRWSRGATRRRRLLPSSDSWPI